MKRHPAACAAIVLFLLSCGGWAQPRELVPGQAGRAPLTLAQDAKPPQSVVLDMTLTKGKGPEMKPSLLVPLGGEASTEPAPGITLQVSRVQVVGQVVSLRIGVSEATPPGLVESLISVDLLLNKPARLQLGSDPARAWVLEFTPRVTPADAKPAS